MFIQNLHYSTKYLHFVSFFNYDKTVYVVYKKIKFKKKVLITSDFVIKFLVLFIIILSFDVITSDIGLFEYFRHIP